MPDLSARERAEEVTFTVRVTMRRRWVSVFLGMLAKMQRLGGVGSSREVIFYSDGDGDYRPKFIVEGTDERPADGRTVRNGAFYFDAG